jgi:hypothetical protein
MAMKRAFLSGSLVMGMLICLPAAAQLPSASGEPVWAKAKAGVAAPVGLRSPVAALSARRIELVAPSAREMQAMAGSEKRAQVGIARNIGAERDGRQEELAWTALKEGGWSAHLQVRSASAASLRLGVAVANLPPGAEVRFAPAGPYGAAATLVPGAEVTAAMREQGIYWGPVIDGDAQLIEITLPAGREPRAIRARIEQVSHLAVSAHSGFAKAAASAVSGVCNEDVACIASPSEAFQNARRAVAKMVFTSNGNTYLCSGTLLNDTDPSSQIPYFHTAAHCIDSQAAASTLNTFWFYESPSCGAGSPGAYTQLSRGAKLLHSNAATDVTLLRLSDPAPQGAWFAGWDANVPATSSNMIALHHPHGDVKKVSVGQVLGLASDGVESLVSAAWISGTTEPGSSGSGMFTLSGNQYLLRGGLKGGSASCENTGRVSDPSNRDYFSRLDLDIAKLATWLNGTNAPDDDFTDNWWNPDEPGWGLNVIQHATNGTMLVWLSYDEAGRAAWVYTPDCKWQGARRCSGTAFRATGLPWFERMRPGAASMQAVGSITAEFTGGDSGVLTVSIDGRSITSNMVRQAF